ncbi:MAG: hypothetical protein HY665_06225 [Chloroflexi bacterium]|nr:hypothetical protein [Chloroflexota bacterium]
MALPNSANIVILASNYNPSIVSREWLYQKGIFTEPVDNFVHTPVLSLVENQNFGFAVDEQKLQLVIKRMTQDNLTNSNAMARRFVDVLPETPYKAVGLNYHYTLGEHNCNLGCILVPKPAKLKAVFSPNYQLGSMIVFSFESFVATFTATPSLVKEQPVKIAFNFHANVANVEELRARVASQIKTLEKAESVIRELCKNG